MTALYGIADYLPGYFIVGLKGWDDFLLCDQYGQYFSVPTLPLEHARLTSFSFPLESLRLEVDEELTQKIKWYVQPILFGGDPTSKENMIWLSRSEHAQAVRYWNKLYFDTISQGKNT